MKKILTLLVTASLAVTAAGCFPFGSIIGRGPVETRTFDLSGFSRVEVSSTFDAEISRGSAFSVTVTTNENIFDYLDLEVNGDTLLVRLKSGSYTVANLDAGITMPDLKALEVSGASEASVSGFNFNHDLDLKVSGASSITVENVKSGNVNIEASGASRVKGSLECGDARLNVSGASNADLSGLGRNLDVTASGASHITLRDFSGAEVKVNFSGASSGTVNASGRLDVQLSGASSLRYFGNPAIGDVNVTGGSSFSKG
ncbi:head GIN domain-containing protein [Dehalogenimonas sp. 4OHTPN]|uniref:Head GIN domain-containing protein n=1 Tax=Dehalogenimonas sp. 4OHTPN TaxID=3166643 RepID=A0AAU8G9P5_9CHLR